MILPRRSAVGRVDRQLPNHFHAHDGAAAKAVSSYVEVSAVYPGSEVVGHGQEQQWRCSCRLEGCREPSQVDEPQRQDSGPQAALDLRT